MKLPTSCSITEMGTYEIVHSGGMVFCILASIVSAGSSSNDNALLRSILLQTSFGFVELNATGWGGWACIDFLGDGGGLS